VVENWNEISEKVKSAGSVIGFKAELKKHLQGRMDPVQREKIKQFELKVQVG
jgi:hypothetical protein